jgi:hypothetical protein
MWRRRSEQYGDAGGMPALVSCDNLVACEQWYSA